MAAGGAAGVVTVWNLEERRLATIIKDAHDAPLVALHFFAGALGPFLRAVGAQGLQGVCLHPSPCLPALLCCSWCQQTSALPPNTLPPPPPPLQESRC
jgi:hypothetical protein